MISELYQSLSDMGVFTSMQIYFIFNIISFAISFYIINKFNFMNKSKATKSLINLFISLLISYVIGMLSLQSDFITNLFVFYVTPLNILFLILFIFTIVLLILMLIDVSKRNFKEKGERVMWVLVILLGTIFGAFLMGPWVYYLMVKRNNNQ